MVVAEWRGGSGDGAIGGAGGRDGMSRPNPKLAIPALLLVVGAAGIWYETGRRNHQAAGTLSGNGTVEATEVDVGSRISGRLLTVVPREGEAVRRGQEVATLEASELEAQVAQARGNLAAAESVFAEIGAGTRAEEIRLLKAQLQSARDVQAQAQARLDLLRAGARGEVLEQLRASVRQAQVALEDAQRDLDRTGQLADQGMVARRDLDVATARRDGTAAALDAARQRLAEAEGGARPEEVRAAEASLAQAASLVKSAQASLDLAVAGPRRETVRAAEARAEAARGAVGAAEALLAQTRIVAPSDGRVTLRNAEPGEVVTPGFPIVRIADLARVWLRVYVPEPQIGRVKAGQRAEVSADAFAGRTFPGVVTEIAERPEYTPKNVQTREERVKLVFGVKVEVENPGGELKPGMPADAVIAVGD
jgi:multidrug resistance efflux pump